MTIGLDHFRTAMLLAVVEKKLGYGFGGEDIHLNVAGGLTIDEPAADLGVVTAVISCIKNKAVPSGMAVMGEIGLSGEIRSVSQPLARIKEASSLGYNSIILPKGNIDALKKEKIQGIDLYGAKNIKEALSLIF